MDKKKYDNQLRRQCFDIPVMCEAQLDGIKRGVAESIPPEVLKKIRKVVVTGCGDSYLAGVAGIPAFKKYAGTFASEFRAERCINVARYLEFEKGNADTTLVIGISASGEPARVVEVLRRANTYGCHSLIITNGPESPAVQEAEYSLLVHTPHFPEPGPGLRNYYASILGLLVLAAAMGEAKKTCLPGTVDELLNQVRVFTASYAERLAAIDEAMFDLAVKWNDHIAVETIGDDTCFASAYFIGAKYVEVAGMMASTMDSEDWCHVNYFKHNPQKLGTIFIANEDDNNYSRIRESINQAVGIERPVLFITDSKGDIFCAADQMNVCTVAKAPEGFEFLSPLLNYIPGSILAAYLAALHGEAYFRGEESLQHQSLVGCTIRDSQIEIM